MCSQVPIPHQKDGPQEKSHIKKTDVILRRVWSVDKCLTLASSLTVITTQDAPSANGPA